MKKGILFAAVFPVLFLFASPAFAAGPYVGFEGGVVWLSDSSFAAVPEVTNAGDLKYDTGWSIGAVGGYDFGTWRLEGEFAYRSNSVKEFVAASGAVDPGDGDYSSMALMANAYYDFRMLSPHVIPYLGAGIGGANVSADMSDNGVNVLDDSQIVFAYQFIGGVAFPVSKQLTVDLNYRYFATTDPSLEIKWVSGVKLDYEYGCHNIFVGLRYSF